MGATNILYFQTVGKVQTHATADKFGDNQDWEGMPWVGFAPPDYAITFSPPLVNINYSSVLLILNVPNAFASGLSNMAPPGGEFMFEFVYAYENPAPLPIASFTYQMNVPPNSAARCPVTLVTHVTPTGQQPPVVKVRWRGVRGNIFLDTPASLSAVLL